MTGRADAITHGTCMCGGVNYTATGPLRNVLQCHCVRCRKFTGNFTAASGALSANISVGADTTLRWFSPTDDPNVAYGFCTECGSSLFWRVRDDPDEHWSICAGSLDDAVGLRTEAIWYSDHAAEYTTLDPAPPHIPSTEL